MQSVASLTFLCFALSLALTACESKSYGYGYVNQLHQTITIIQHGRGGVDKSTLPSKARQLPTERDSVAKRVEFFDVHRRQIAVYTLDDYKRSRHPGVPPVLVVSRSGVTLASPEFWRNMAREWDGPSPSKPVSFGGGDGSSIEKAIIVHALTATDDTLAVYAYIRERFGYMWTYRSMERYLIPTEDKLYDMYEFVTRDGKKHVLYFENDRLVATKTKGI